MLILLIHRNGRIINYQIYKFFQKKYSLQLNGKIDFSNFAAVNFTEINSQNKKNHDEIRNDLENDLLKSHIDFQLLVANSPLINKEHSIIVNKISHGGDTFNEITLLSEQAIEKLAEYSILAPGDQEADLELTKTLLNMFPKAKHYASFETAFHATISNTHKMLLPSLEYTREFARNYGKNGLLFAAINQRLNDITEKKIAKGKWLFIDIDATETIICAVKNNKSVYSTASFIHDELLNFKSCGLIDPQLALIIEAKPTQISNLFAKLNLSQLDIPNKSILEIIKSDEPAIKILGNYYFNQLIATIGKLAAIMKGLHGIVFTGKIAALDPQIRGSICEQLEWLGVELGNKNNAENKFKISKKSSKVEVYAIQASPLDGMLYQLLDRM
ncbi:acetate/propionate family kinase [Aquella oligotrophica]|uniref:Uncharacterized protein n=1 Tax=Aquella oligotrophica TaxID=2067065 RepID=A0A2I7N3T9_9NEIS|nr:acetate/propionate family kinase [Aquella oligotrophica]AUR51134.1 hypothetical protein CUN60_02055 [Aquella oligotrophica]